MNMAEVAYQLEQIMNSRVNFTFIFVDWKGFLVESEKLTKLNAFGLGLLIVTGLIYKSESLKNLP